jgi:Amino acid permeases
LIFGFILVLGYKFLGRVNTILFSAMIFAFVLLIVSGTTEIQWINLKRENWSYGLFFTSPLMLAIFSFPGIVPSITYQLHKDARSVKLAIVIGMLVTLLVYIVWIFFVLGSVPYEGPFGLMEACTNDIPISQCIHYLSNNPLVSISAKFFTFFAIATSFLGISLSLFDFFFDTFRAKKRNLSTDMAISSLVVLPSLVITLLFEKVFVRALEISGGFGDAILSGCIPVLMIWNGRYNKKYQGDYTFPGGKPLLFVLLAIALSVFISEFITVFF